MAMLSFKENFRGDQITFTFDCEYVEIQNSKYGKSLNLQLKNTSDNYFDSGDFRIKIQEAISNLTEANLKNYEDKYIGIRYIAIAQYFLKAIPSIFSVKFESATSESVYYAEELGKMNKE